MKMYETTQSVEKYLNVSLECSCGMTHYAPIKAVNISRNALSFIPSYMLSLGHSHPYLLCDSITWKIAGKQCEQILLSAGYPVYTLILKHAEFDEATLGEIVLNKPDDCDVMIGCGTGSITDMLRFSSFKLGVPCFTVATAAPMDGFSASVGIMNVNNVKKTMPAHSTEVFIGDTEILKNAPFRMTLAGFGDLIGKLNSLNDWRLGVLVNDEHICENIATMVHDYVTDIIGKANLLASHDPKTIGDLLNALLLTGLTVSLYGSSRAISGAEHHMSHYWEILGAQRGKSFAMHGEQVAVATVLTLSLAELLKDRKIDFARARSYAKTYNHAAWEAEIHRAYGKAAEEILTLQSKAMRDSAENRLRRIDHIEAKWPDIISLLSSLPSSFSLQKLLKSIGCPCTPLDIGISADILHDTLLYSKETRCIYTICQLISDLGLSEETSEELIRRFSL